MHTNENGTQCNCAGTCFTLHRISLSAVVVPDFFVDVVGSKAS